MKIFLNIMTFLLILAVTAEKIAVIFVSSQSITVLAETEESKKCASEEEADTDKKTEDPDKYYKSNSNIKRQGLSASKRFGTGDTPLRLNPYYKSDPKPPKAA